MAPRWVPSRTVKDPSDIFSFGQTARLERERELEEVDLEFFWSCNSSAGLY